MTKANTVTITEEQFDALIAAATAPSSPEQAAVETSKVKATVPVKRLSVVFEALEGEDAEKYGDVSITKLLPNGTPRKRMVLVLDEAVEFADFVMENFADRL